MDRSMIFFYIEIVTIMKSYIIKNSQIMKIKDILL